MSYENIVMVSILGILVVILIYKLIKTYKNEK
ncbi:hypothetical protein AA20_06230 [Aliarcobacter butzleri L348]|uniref:Uncharacterized protein n=2 Tax=Aliarcobacter butzleri TaxID=28197 RepID=A0A837J4Y6_9BACT|nr:hypothetical protein AA20_06230 [Aliarcobacter butzleri L348]KLE00382.1 hypothetical protein AF76_07685 [Aliarcobacter butzleri L351]KLE12116.1 hypothetical protein AF75_10310 [Aliarcobacter butzleri L350]